MTPTGDELSQQYSVFGEPSASAAPGAALGPDFGPIDPDLATVIEAWPALPEAVRAGILASIGAARQAMLHP